MVIVLKLYRGCHPWRSVLLPIVGVVLFFVAAMWIFLKPENPEQRHSLSALLGGVEHNSAEFKSTKMTLQVSDGASMHFNPSRSVTKVANAKPGSKNAPTCPNSGHTKAITDNNLCKDQNKFVVYSKLIDNFPLARFRDYQKSVADCKLPDGVTCLYTEDDSLYGTADVLYIHECFSFCETPAYPEQIIVRYNLGPEIEDRPCNNGTIQVADIKINFHMSSSIPWLYLCLPGIKQPLMDALRLGVPSNRHGIAMFVSDCKATFSQWRYKYLTELMKYIKIDSYGKCFHNTAMNSTRHDTKKYDIKVDLLKKKRYKFLIAFENTHQSEYITEKIWHAYMSQTIPIYYGAPEIYKQVPGRNTFIDAAKFAGPKQLAEYIKKVDRNRKLYQSFFDFDISRLETFEKAWCSEIPLSCHLCSKAYQIKQSRCGI